MGYPIHIGFPHFLTVLFREFADPLVEDDDDDDIYMPIVQDLEDEHSPLPPPSLPRPRPRPRPKRAGSLTAAVRRIIDSEDEAGSGEESGDAAANNAAENWEDSSMSLDDVADRAAGGMDIPGWSSFSENEPSGVQADTTVAQAGKSCSHRAPGS